ncbi:MAG TPA: RES family NAD+ phosphorylase [Thermoanaerobaculia bacterium]|nr:RES family NAD+ phosphorylase [Thermoanaerobaculia bacterium]
MHRAGRNPWWFSSGGLGRFDLRERPGSPPWKGTCYLATTPLGCFIEVFREGFLVPAAELEERSISHLALPSQVNLADCTSSRSRAFGITAEVHSTPHYEITQAWAAAFESAGFHGIHYFLRHDPGQRLTGVALFGPAGAGTGASGYPPGLVRPIGPDILAEAASRFGILTLPAP